MPVSVHVIDPGTLRRTQQLYDLIMEAPFPSPEIITDMVSRQFPELPQKDTYPLVQHIKKSIAIHQFCYIAYTDPTNN